MRTLLKLLSLLAVMAVSFVAKPKVVPEGHPQNPDSLKKVQEAVANAGFAIGRARAIFDTSYHSESDPMEEACKLSQIEGKLSGVKEYRSEVLLQAQISEDSLLFYTRGVSLKIAWELKKVFDLPRRVRQGEEKCPQLDFGDSIFLMKKLLHHLDLAQVPFDSASSKELRAVLLGDLKEEVKDIRRDTPEYVSKDQTVRQAVCEWKFSWRALGLKVDEIPECAGSKQAPAPNPALRLT